MSQVSWDEDWGLSALDICHNQVEDPLNCLLTWLSLLLLLLDDLFRLIFPLGLSLEVPVLNSEGTLYGTEFN